MKTIRILLVAVLVSINALTQNEVKHPNRFALKSISEAVTQYHHRQKGVSYGKYMVVTMKIMNMNNTSGEFVLRNEENDKGYFNLKPTHYLRVNNEVILIIRDSTCNCNLEKFGISKISDEVKKEALDILAGPNIGVLRQSPPFMIFKYKGKKLEGKFYHAAFLPDDKYRF